MRARLGFSISLWSLVACAQPGGLGPVANGRVWQSGKITRAEQPERRKPEPYEVWNPLLTHWYTLETPSATIKATEMVPSGVKRQPGAVSGDVDRAPAMAFRVGETVRFSVQERLTHPNAQRELYVLDRKGKEHTLTVDVIVSHGTD